MSTPSSTAQRLGSLLVIVAVVWHLLTVLSPPAQRPPANTAGRDYATYHYAAKVARAGGDPYTKRELGELAREEATRNWVHPYLYPPPFLVLATPFSLGSLDTGFAAWFVLNELALLVVAWSLVRWWSGLSTATPGVVAAVVALTYGIAYGAELGQANLVVLALVVLSAWQVQSRPRWAGALLGVACMLKMSPALLLGWFALERRWSAVTAALVAAAASIVVSVGVLGIEGQLRFYGEVLPGLLGGDYNGLTIKLGMFGNHSVPNVMHQIFPSGSEVALAPRARVASLLVLVPWLGWLAWQWANHPQTDRWGFAARFSVVGLTMLLVPAYTYEHHLVLAIPAMVLAVLAVIEGRLSASWAPGVAVAVVVLAYPLPHLRTLAQWLGEGSGGWVVQEAPFMALWALAFAMVQLGRADPAEARS